METTLEAELKELLENIPRSYPDFVRATMEVLKGHEDLMERLVEYIKQNPDNGPGENLRFQIDELHIFDLIEDEPMEDEDDF